MTVFRWSRALALTPPKFRWSKATATGTTGAPKFRWSSVRATGSSNLALVPIADTTVDAFTAVTIQVTPTATSITPTGYSWRQISGSPVAFSDNGTSITFTAPPSMLGEAIIFGVTAYYNSTASNEVTSITNTVPHLDWYATSSGWQPFYHLEAV